MSARPNLLARYDTLRRADVKSRTFAVDLAQPHALVRFSPGAKRAGASAST
jgi:hypothetical protein